MAFIKRGDGKILTVIEENQLTDEQKKLADEALKQAKTDSSKKKNQGDK